MGRAGIMSRPSRPGSRTWRSAARADRRRPRSIRAAPSATDSTDREPRLATDRPQLAPLQVTDVDLEPVLHRGRGVDGLRRPATIRTAKLRPRPPETRRNACRVTTPPRPRTRRFRRLRTPRATGTIPRGHRPAAKVTAARCPINSTLGCIDCHMPRIWVESTHSFKTDHFIRVR